MKGKRGYKPSLYLATLFKKLVGGKLAILKYIISKDLHDPNFSIISTLRNFLTVPKLECLLYGKTATGQSLTAFTNIIPNQRNHSLP